MMIDCSLIRGLEGQLGEMVVHLINYSNANENHVIGDTPSLKRTAKIGKIP